MIKIKNKEEFNNKIKPNNLVIYESDIQDLLATFSDEQNNFVLHYDAKNISSLETLYMILKRIRKMYGPYGNTYEKPFYLFINNFNKLLDKHKELEIYLNMEKYIKDTFISIIITK